MEYSSYACYLNFIKKKFFFYERNEEEVEEGTAWTVSNITLKITNKKIVSHIHTDEEK